MTNKQIIKNAIEKAELSDFNIEIFCHKLKNPDSTVSPSTRSAVFVDENIDEIMEHSTSLLFDIRFAKGFWGEEGWNMEWDDLKKLHEWALDRVEFSAGATEVYRCHLCGAEKINDIVYFDDCDSGRTTIKPCCHSVSYLEAHGAKYTRGWQDRLREIVLLSTDERLRYLEKFLIK